MAEPYLDPAKKSLLYVFSPVELIQYVLQGELVVVLWRYPKGFRCETLQGTEPISSHIAVLLSTHNYGLESRQTTARA